ncbi:MAG: hypothetical protein IPL61_40440 [Myxococcales bacterium]|nr:hypothetical protein [Myxococcales bacterium]
MKRFALVLLAAAAAPAAAGTTATWTVETYAQFEAGDASDAYLTSLGEVRPGWQTTRIELGGDGVWAALRLASGTIVVGTDAEGTIQKIDGGKASKLAAIPGALATVALAESGTTLYAGAMPSDTVWKLDRGGGKPVAFAKLPGVETVWALAAGSDGTIYAGTGPAGKVFAIDKGGKARQLFDTEDKRVTAVTVTSDGAVWFGTSERALVFRYDPRTKNTRAMADFAGNEIAAIAEVAGGVVVAANELAPLPAGATKDADSVAAAEKPTAPKGQATKLPDVGSKPGADKETPAAADAQRKGARKGKGALFRIGPEGQLEQLHALTQTYFTSIAVAPDGAIYAGAADKGRVYLVEPDDTVATAFDVDERAVAQVFWDGQRLAFTTDDTAALYHVGDKASSAKYVSEVFDAKGPSQWGRILWQGTGKLVVETRSGNTAKPGVGWSAWAAPGKVATAGGGTTGGMIASPSGRYLQYRVSLPDDGAVRRVTSYYLPQNTGTAIDEITIELATKETQPTLKEAGGKARNPTMRVKWKIDNSDSDDTSYVLSVRRDGDADWRALSLGKPPFTATTFEWNTETFADGWYRLRVTSSDALANSPDRALEVSRTSALFVVDNTPPVVDGLAVKAGRADARITDALSVVTELAYAIDDETWRMATTVDGIFDDQTEALRLAVPTTLAKGTHTLSIRAADAAGNVAAATVSFVVK